MFTQKIQCFSRTNIIIMAFAGVFLFNILKAYASPAGAEHIAHGGYAITFLWMAILLIMAKLSSFVEKIGQPSVLGELIIGVILGNLFLLGINFFEPIKNDEFLKFLAELGVVILLFQVGLESNIAKMRKVGIRAFFVASLGVIIPFALGAWVVGPWLLPGLHVNTYLFIGAILTATSVGITARVFQDLNKLHTPEAQIVLGAAVLDDIFGLVMLAVVSQIVTNGAASFSDIGFIAFKAIIFLVGSIAVGNFFTHPINRFFSKVHAGVGMKFTVAICFGLLFAYFAQFIGLAPIIGAFAAGLVLDPVHFKYFRDPKIVRDIRELIKDESPEIKNKFNNVIAPHADRHIEDIVKPIGLFLVPIFFVITGMSVRLDAMFNTSILLVALGITVAAFIGKIVCGLAAGKVKKSIVGWGMVPRGEVGLIFAAMGKGLGVLSDDIFSVIVILVILTTLLPPPILAYLIKKADKLPVNN